MKTILFILLFIVPSACAEVQIGGSLGFSPNFTFGLNDPDTSGDSVIFDVNARLRSKYITGAGIEVSILNAKGVRTSMLFDVIRTNKFRFNIINPGIFIPWDDPVIIPEVRRDFDITFGSGVEIHMVDNYFLTIHANIFVPNPAPTVKRRGDLAPAAFNESIKGAYLCVGFSSLVF